MPTGDLPLHGVTETLLEPEPEAARASLEAALSDPEPATALRATAAAHPTSLDAWARLAEQAQRQDDPVAAYAFARTGYHRGLDRIRKAGWGGQGPVPWHHEPNRGFLRAVRALMRAADAIGETEEADRCRAFLSELGAAEALEAED